MKYYFDIVANIQQRELGLDRFNHGGHFVATIFKSIDKIGFAIHTDMIENQGDASTINYLILT